MIKCIAIYPHEIDSKYKENVEQYITRAKNNDFNEVFTTVHLPEYSLDLQLETLGIISQITKRNGLELTCDIGGKTIDLVLADENYLNKLKNIELDFIRLDYGFNLKQVEQLYRNLNIQGFVINASTYSEREVDEIYQQFKAIDSSIKLRACHNFYVRNESGIDDCFAIRQDSYFKKYDMPIYYCIATFDHPRGPLHLGLTTIEKHRKMNVRDVVVDLYLNHDLSALMMSDEWVSDQDLYEVNHSLELLEIQLDTEEVIEVSFTSTATIEEKEIVLGKHHFRYDSPYAYLRSQSSREMSEYACQIKPNNTIERVEGCITIDNVNNKRYSGELQVVMKDSNSDIGANVVANIINKDDLIKLARFREGIDYKFVQGKSL